MLPSQLRPTYFSVAGSDRVYSGFKTRLMPGVEQFDIWAYPYTMMTIVEHMGSKSPFSFEDISAMPVNPLGVVVVPHAILTLVRGDVVTFADDVDLTPLAFIQRGENAIVVKLDVLTGERWFWLEAHHTSLEGDQSTVSVFPHHDGELIASIRLYLDRYDAYRSKPQEDIA